MRRATRLLLVLVGVAVLVPLVPFLLFGTRLDRVVAGWLDPPPPLPVVALLEIGVLAFDLLLPVPSSVVATYGGARLGPWLGTLCAWLGMTIGALAGWWLGRKLGRGALENLDAEDRTAIARGHERLGPLLVVLTRPLPLLAEATALAAGGMGMPLSTFLPAAAVGNAVIAAAWSALGALGREELSLVMLVALVVPVALVWGVVRSHRADVTPGPPPFA
jgi:uncharacterized membrane protein YdjX (TVP38/TMEM64 family)